ncbi:MAG: hypothetical protein ABI175_26955, partial [Polyangiales bacterium]
SLMRTPVPSQPLLLPLVLVFAAALAPLAGGCDDKQPKPGAPTAASASTSAPAVVASVDAAPDPKEVKYAKLRKDLKDRNLAFLTSLQKIYGGAGKDEETTWKAYFPKTKEGAKEADDIFKEAAFTGKEGMSITGFDVSDLSFDEKLLHCTADVSEKQMQRGKPRCVIYKLQWEEQAGVFVRTAKTDMNIIPCP